MIKNLVNYYIKHNFLFKKYIKDIEYWHSIDTNTLAELENEAFLKMFNWAIKKTKYYPNKLAEYGTNVNEIKSLSDIKKIPILTREDLQKNVSLIKTKNIFSIASNNSGTSGSILTVYRDIYSIIKEQAFHYYFRQLHGFNVGDRLVTLRGRLSNKKLFDYDKLNNTLYISSYKINDINIKEIYNKIKSFNPKAFWSYPSSLEILANTLYKNNLCLNIPLAFTSSEMVYDFQIDKIQHFLGSKVFDWYGCSERTIAIGKYKDDKYRIIPMYGYAEIEESKVITTAFMNKCFPLIRYEVKDILIESSETINQSCQSKKVINRIEGRDDDYIILPDGTQIGRLGVPFNSMKNIELAQVVQYERSKLMVNIVPNKYFKDDDEKKIYQTLKNYIGKEICIEVCKLSEDKIIRKGNNRKYKLVINYLLEDTKRKLVV